jgi:hypothetical protein
MQSSRYFQTTPCILIGDVWVMSGQSNMAFPLGKVNGGEMEAAQADLPMLRLCSITTI